MRSNLLSYYFLTNYRAAHSDGRGPLLGAARGGGVAFVAAAPVAQRAVRMPPPGPSPPSRRLRRWCRFRHRHLYCRLAPRCIWTSPPSRLRLCSLDAPPPSLVVYTTICVQYIYDDLLINSVKPYNVMHILYEQAQSTAVTRYTSSYFIKCFSNHKTTSLKYFEIEAALRGFLPKYFLYWSSANQTRRTIFNTRVSRRVLYFTIYFTDTLPYNCICYIYTITLKP